MILSNPSQVRQLYAEQKKWLTVEEIAAGLDMSTRTISKALNSKPVQPATVHRFAAALGLDPTDIATFVTGR